METQKAYFAIIPANVRYDKELSANAKLLYGELTALTYKEGYCFASNNYFAELYDVSPQAISKWVKQLEAKGYVKITYLYNGSEIKERHIYIQETKQEIEKEKVSTEVYTSNDEVSTKDEKGINKRLKGYQQKIKDNNTLNKTNNNTYIQKEKSKHSFRNEDYKRVYNIYYTNRSRLFHEGRITNEEYVIGLEFKKVIKKAFENYGVEQVIKAVSDSVNDDWLIQNQYPLTFIFGPKELPKLINKTYSNSDSLHTEKFTEVFIKDQTLTEEELREIPF